MGGRGRQRETEGGGNRGREGGRGRQRGRERRRKREKKGELLELTNFDIHQRETENKILFLSDEVLETLDFTICFGSTGTPTFSYFDLYLYTAYAAHYVYFNFDNVCII